MRFLEPIAHDQPFSDERLEATPAETFDATPELPEEEMEARGGLEINIGYG